MVAKNAVSQKVSDQLTTIVPTQGNDRNTDKNTEKSRKQPSAPRLFLGKISGTKSGTNELPPT